LLKSSITPLGVIRRLLMTSSERTKEKLAIKAEGKRLGGPRSSEVKLRLIACGEGRNIEGGMQDGVNYGTAIRYPSHDPEYLKARHNARL